MVHFTSPGKQELARATASWFPNVAGSLLTADSSQWSQGLRTPHSPQPLWLPPGPTVSSSCRTHFSKPKGSLQICAGSRGPASPSQHRRPRPSLQTCPPPLDAGRVSSPNPPAFPQRRLPRVCQPPLSQAGSLSVGSTPLSSPQGLPPSSARGPARIPGDSGLLQATLLYRLLPPRLSPTLSFLLPPPHHPTSLP